LGPIPNPQSPIPNPQYKLLLNNLYCLENIIILIFIEKSFYIININTS
jgi:hypothetical protein